ncbi:MAG: NAD(P)H-dependent oxidoreductase, partial [Algoriella sp.]
LRIDSTPVEGFSSQVFDEVLDLPAKGLKSTVIMYLGYSDTSKDWLSSMKKVRIPMNEFAIRAK